MKRIILRYLLFLPLLAITFQSKALDLPVKVVKGIEVYYYKVNSKESVYGISKKLGISREDIVRHNPSVADGVKRGMMLYFPVAEYSEAEHDIATEPAEQPVLADTIIEKNPSIALLLPFGLGAQEPSRENKFALDFYKGFLIGADTLSHRQGNVEIYAIDTDDKSESISGILSKQEIKDATIIVAPPNPTWLNAIADSALANRSYVLNLFVIHDSLYLSNQRMLQASIPQKDMYRLATDALLSQYTGYTPVILRNKDGKNEKEAFVNYVCERYRNNSVEPVVIEYENNLLVSEIEVLPTDGNERYVIIPSSGSLAEFNRFAYVVKSFRDKLFTTVSDDDSALSSYRSRIEIFGYPDWTAFRGDALDTLHKLGATIYSRFNDNYNDYSYQTIESDFMKWFGTEIIESVPNQALLGYDAACLLIKNILINNGEFNPAYPQRFEGIQSTYDFEKTHEGYYNATLYIINYQPGGQVSARTL